MSDDKQSVQPVAWACWLSEDHRDGNPQLSVAEPRAYPNRAPLFYAAAQPVEVQRVPLTCESCGKTIAEHGKLLQCHTAIGQISHISDDGRIATVQLSGPAEVGDLVQLAAEVGPAS